MEGGSEETPLTPDRAAVKNKEGEANPEAKPIDESPLSKEQQAAQAAAKEAAALKLPDPGQNAGDTCEADFRLIMIRGPLIGLVGICFDDTQVSWTLTHGDGSGTTNYQRCRWLCRRHGKRCAVFQASSDVAVIHFQFVTNNNHPSRPKLKLLIISLRACNFGQAEVATKPVSSTRYKRYSSATASAKPTICLSC